MKRVVALLLICVALISSIFLALHSIDCQTIALNFLKKNDILIVKSVNNASLKIFPRPHFLIDSVTTENIELNDAKFTFSLLSLIRFQPKVIDLEISRLKLYTDIYYLSVQQHDQLIANLISYYKHKTHLTIKEFSLLDPNHQPIIYINNLTFTTDEQTARNIASGNIKGFGTFLGTMQPLDDSIKVELTFNSLGYDIQLSEVYKDSALTNGTISCQIKSITELVKFHLPDFAASLAGVTQNEPIAIKANIAVEEQLLRFKDIVVNAKAVNGNGDIAFARNSEATSILELQFAKLDLKSLFTTNNTAFTTYNTQKRLNLANNKLRFTLNMNEINLQNNDAIHDFKLITNLENGKLSIEELSGQIQSGGSFKLDGVIAQNDVRSVFDGSIALQYGDLNAILLVFGCDSAASKKPLPFALMAEISATPIDLFLKNIVLKTHDFEVTGDVSGKLIGAMPHIKSLLNVSAINFDDNEYPIFSPALQFIKSLTVEMKAQDYLNKFVPIRNIGYTGNFDITFNDLTLYGKNLDRVNLVSSIAPSKVEVNSLYINHGQDFLNMCGTLVANELKPEFQISVKDGMLPISFLNPQFLLELRNDLNEQYDFNKLSMQFDCFFSQLYYNDLSLEEVVFTGANDDTLFNINMVSANLLSGNLEAHGSILLDPYTWNFVYALNTVDLSALSQILPNGWLNPNGVGSIHGMVTTNGTSIEKMLYNLYTKSSFIIKDTIINNFSIDDLVNKIANTSYDATTLDADINNSLSQGQTNVGSINGDIELSNGIMKINNIDLKTQYTVASASAMVNIYDLQLKLSSIFSFNLNSVNVPSTEKFTDVNVKANTKHNRYSKHNAYSGTTKRAMERQAKKAISLDIAADGTVLEPHKTTNSSPLKEWFSKQIK